MDLWSLGSGVVGNWVATCEIYMCGCVCCRVYVSGGNFGLFNCRSPGVSDLMGFYTPEAQGEVEDDVGVALEEEVVLVDPLELPPSPDFPTDDQEKKSPPAKPASSLSLASGTSAEDTIMVSRR